MDDPNWQIVISFGPFQSRSCRPTYTEWQPEDNSAPSSNDDPAAAELVFGAPRCESLFRVAAIKRSCCCTLSRPPESQYQHGFPLRLLSEALRSNFDNLRQHD